MKNKYLLAYLAFVFILAGCKSTNILHEENGYIMIPIAVPVSNDDKESKGDMHSQQESNPQIFLLNNSKSQIKICLKQIPQAMAVSLSLEQISNCGGYEAIEETLDSENLVIKSLEKNERIWVIEDRK